MAFYTYILASRRNGTLYVGHTDDLRRRMGQHHATGGGFARRYGVKFLVWFESFETRAGAFHRERAIKKWNRAWKLELIENTNPGWRDFTDELNSWLPFD